jgi:FMN reductase
VYAAAQDWGGGGLAADGSLVDRIDRAAREIATAIVAHPPVASADPFETPVPFEQLLGSTPSDD